MPRRYMPSVSCRCRLQSLFVSSVSTGSSAEAPGLSGMSPTLKITSLFSVDHLDRDLFDRISDGRMTSSWIEGVGRLSWRRPPPDIPRTVGISSWLTAPSAWPPMAGQSAPPH
jgi:hypothetical protein